MRGAGWWLRCAQEPFVESGQPHLASVEQPFLACRPPCPWPPDPSSRAAWRAMSVSNTCQQGVLSRRQADRAARLVLRLHDPTLQQSGCSRRERGSARGQVRGRRGSRHELPTCPPQSSPPRPLRWRVPGQAPPPRRQVGIELCLTSRPLQISGGARRTISVCIPPEVQVRRFRTARIKVSFERAWVQKRNVLFAVRTP